MVKEKRNLWIYGAGHVGTAIANTIDKLEAKSLKEIPSFKSGDTVAVSYKIKEGDKERIQIFEGIVISKSGGSIRETFTVRKIKDWRYNYFTL